ncbi:MAG TPA: methyltransferase domain-containing protein [Aliiroseovarius sp.]|nr:methyltransferase domain-containing protein [Aliiroseovarius sp.]
MNHDNVRDYYGDVLQSSADLQTNACCTASAIPDNLKAILAKIHDEVLAKYYGCGLIAPTALEGARILDLGCGAGRDVYALSAMVGPNGSVVGVDMTKAQLDVARAHQDFHARAFGYDTPNTSFHLGLIEELDALGLEPGSFDIIVSNCVLNLAMDKPAVLRGVFNLLKPGGEMYFSDVYADRRVPDALRQDKVLYGECLSGALYWNDFEHMARAAGFTDPRLVDDRVLTIENAALQAKLGQIGFHAATYRLFKIDGLEPACEDYGQAVIYKGGLADMPDQFVLDKHHVMDRGRVFAVCGNTYRILRDSRFQRYFDFIGTWDQHFGLFAGCGSSMPFGPEQPDPDPATVTATAATSGACC